MFVASDANEAGLAEIAWRAARKPARGGIPNLLCIAEPLHELSRELGAIADRITIILPWANLLKAVATPETESLRHIAHLCLPGASVEIVLSYDERDARERTLFDVHSLPRLYEQAGLRIVSIENISQRELRAYETTWAGRLACGRERQIWRIRALSTHPEYA